MVIPKIEVVESADKLLIETYKERCDHFKSHIDNQALLIESYKNVIQKQNETIYEQNRLIEKLSGNERSHNVPLLY